MTHDRAVERYRRSWAEDRRHDPAGGLGARLRQERTAEILSLLFGFAVAVAIVGGAIAALVLL